jgi:hypothetical protein
MGHSFRLQFGGGLDTGRKKISRDFFNSILLSLLFLEIHCIVFTIYSRYMLMFYVFGLLALWW